MASDMIYRSKKKKIASKFTYVKMLGFIHKFKNVN